jgi:hypothetical protein
MNIIPTSLPGLLILEPKLFRDDRGHFLEAWSESRFVAAGLPARFVQDNISCSEPGVLRGLHYQHPNGQGKLVSVLRGEVLDVAVDIRVGSPTTTAASSSSRPVSPTGSPSPAIDRPSSGTNARPRMIPNARAASAGMTPTWPSPGPRRPPGSRPRTGLPPAWPRSRLNDSRRTPPSDQGPSIERTQPTKRSLKSGGKGPSHPGCFGASAA